MKSISKLFVLFSLTLSFTAIAQAETTSSEVLSPIIFQSSNPCQITMTERDSLHIRRAPGGAVCDWKMKGDTLEVTGRQGSWFKVRACGGEAYAHRVGFKWQSLDREGIGSCAQTSSFQDSQSSSHSTATGESEVWRVGWQQNIAYQRLAFQKAKEQNLDRLNPQDIGRYCPRYNQFSRDQRLKFWSAFMYAMSIPESSTDTNLTYEEKFSDTCRVERNRLISGKVISTGLLQVSACSCMYYGEKIWNLSTLKNPSSNLSCGARVLSRQISRHNVIGGGSRRGAGSYWYVIRNSKKNEEVRGHLRRAFPQCFQFANELYASL